METWLVALLAGGSVAVLGGVFLVMGLLRSREVRDWQRADGVVVGHERRRRRGHGRRTRPGTPGRTHNYHARYRWRDQHGDVHERTSPFGTGRPPREGKPVAVRFDPERPERAIIDNVAQRGTLFTVVGAAAVVAGCVLAFGVAAATT